MQKQLPAVLVMFIIFITGTKACESSICLSWTLKTHETLKLICRVGFLHYSVKILGPSGEEEAFCFAPVQHSKCDHFSRGFVEQNLKTNETIVTFLHVNSRFNGIWTCEHGVGIGTATTEVLLTSSNGLMEENGGQTCIWEFLSWTMIGLLPTFIILRITVWIFLNKLKDSKLYKTITSCDMIKGKRKKSASEAFFIVGAIIAVTFNLMLNESNGCLSTIYLSGPKYIETGSRINLSCSSDNPPPELIADFLINNKSHTSIAKTKEGCFNTKLRSRCDSISCGCSDDGKTYDLQLDGLLLKGVNDITCLMRIHAMNIIDRLKIYVVDVVGPTLTINDGFPLEVGTDIKLMCTVQTDLQEFEFSLNCSSLTSVSERHKNSTLYIIRIQLKADKKHHGKVCSCSFIKDTIKKSVSLDLYIIDYPLINVQENVSCNGSADIKFSCVGFGELTEIGFSDWTHSMNRTLIRKLIGDTKGKMSVLTIPHCTYRDVDDYLCSAFNTYQNKRFWSNKTTSVYYEGSPTIISTSTHTMSNTIFSVHYVSIPSPKEEQWYLSGELLRGLPGFLFSSAKASIYIDVYGKSVLTEGYSANLTITSNASGVYTVVLENDFGIAKHQFILKAAGSKFSMNVMILVLAVGVVFIITTVVTVLVMNKRNRQYFFSRTELVTSRGAIYYAAPPPETADSSHTYDSTSPRYEVTGGNVLRRLYDIIGLCPDEMNEHNKEEDIVHDYMEIQ